MQYKVKKNKYNRYAFRFAALIFVVVGIVSVFGFYINIKSGQKLYATVTGILIAVCVSYGVFLIKETFKITAYDITYFFESDLIRMSTMRGERKLKYEDVDDIGLVVPSPDIDYIIIQIKTPKLQYVIPFIDNSQYGYKIYDFLKNKVDEDEA